MTDPTDTRPTSPIKNPATTGTTISSVAGTGTPDAFTSLPINFDPSAPRPSSWRPAHQAAPSPAQSTDAKRSPTWLWAKLVVGVLTLAVLFTMGSTLFMKLAGGLTERTESFQGYTYSFQFYKKATPTMLHQSTGTVREAPGLTYKHSALAFAMPDTDDPITTCEEIGSGWRQAFSVVINGVERPVCNSLTASPGVSMFMTNFTAYDVTHLFTVGFNQGQSGGPSLARDNQALQAMFSSIKVTK